MVGCRGPDSFFRDLLSGVLFAGNDMNADISRAPYQLVDDRAMQDLEPSRSRGFADDDLSDVIGMREADDVISDAPAGGDRHRFSAQALGQA